MRLLDLFRHLGQGRENTRRLALDVAAHAGELTGRRVPAGWEALSTQELLRVARSSLTAAEDRIRNADLRIAALEEELALARRDPGSGTAPPDDPPPIVNDLIEVADRLAMLEPAPGQEGAAARWLEGRVAAMLARHGVSVIRDEGPVDPSRHEVVDVRPAPADGDVERIAGTVRPGYSWRNRVLRPQQVVAFVTKRTR